MIISNKITRVIGIGETISLFKNKFINSVTFENVAEFSNAFDNLNFGNETILIKGARDFNFEKITQLFDL